MGYRPRDSGTANSAHKRRGRTELVGGRTKESPATRRVKACLQGADNAKEIRRAKTTNANNTDDLIRGGEGRIRLPVQRFSSSKILVLPCAVL
jgi:hypothetical protein